MKRKVLNVVGLLTLMFGFITTTMNNVAEAVTNNDEYTITNDPTHDTVYLTVTETQKPGYCYNQDKLPPLDYAAPNKTKFHRYDYYQGMNAAIGDRQRVNKTMTVLLMGYPNNLLSSALTPIAERAYNQAKASGTTSEKTLDDFMRCSTQEAVWEIESPDGKTHLGGPLNEYTKALVNIANAFPLDESTAKATNVSVVDTAGKVINDQNPLVINEATGKSQEFQLNGDYNLPISVDNIAPGLEIYNSKGEKVTYLLPGEKYYAKGKVVEGQTLNFKANFFSVVDDNFYTPVSPEDQKHMQNVVNTSYASKSIDIPVVSKAVESSSESTSSSTTESTVTSTTESTSTSTEESTTSSENTATGTTESTSTSTEESTTSSENTATGTTESEEKTNVVISKQDIAGNEIAGAHLKVTDKNGNVVEEWVSEAGKSHEIALADGEYTLTETQAPAGFEIAESINFTVKNGKVLVDGKEFDKVVMIDRAKTTEEKTNVVISKQDIAGNEIAGAHLKVTDKNGNVVEEWVSEAGKSHEIALADGEYTLTETQAPAGFEIAESINFTVKNGKVLVDGKEFDKVVMIDRAKTTEDGKQIIVKDNNGGSNNGTNGGAGSTKNGSVGTLPQTGNEKSTSLVVVGSSLVAITTIVAFVIYRKKAHQA